MRIFDCTTFFDENLMLEIRFNILNDYVDKFVITEAKYSHSGDKKKLISLAEKLKIDGSILWIEFTKNVGDIYQNLDVVVMPSLEYESFGRIIVESMAYSVPIIATRVGGMPELIEHGKDGFLVGKNDENTLSDSIIKLLSDQKYSRNTISDGV